MSYRIDSVTSSRAPEFEAAFTALFQEFGPRGELERRDVIAGWLDAPAATPESPRLHSYHLLVGRDERGALAGVRDCHVVVDRGTRVAVVYLAHVLVLEPYRRTGLAALLRREPIALARRALGDATGFELLLAAEMEPAVRDDPASLVRLIAYGKDDFSVISPAILPYFQPDFRDLGADPVGRARPLPLLPVVRRLEHEHSTRLPKALARAFVEHLAAVFATHVDPRQLRLLTQHTLGRLDAHPEDEVPLLALPRSLDDHDRIAALALTPSHDLPEAFRRRPS